MVVWLGCVWVGLEPVSGLVSVYAEVYAEVGHLSTRVGPGEEPLCVCGVGAEVGHLVAAALALGQASELYGGTRWGTWR